MVHVPPQVWAAYKGPEEFLAMATGSAGACCAWLSSASACLRTQPCARQAKGACAHHHTQLHNTLLTAGKDILDFYGDERARALFKHHIWVLVSRH